MSTPSVEIGLGSVSQALADGVEDLISFNWTEVYKDADDFPLDMDWPKVLMLERVGIYKAVLAHKKGKLVGFSGYYVQPPIRHKTMVWAVNDTLYVDPDHRASTTGVRLLKAAEDIMRGLGAKLIMQGNLWPEGKARARFGDLLVRLGYEPIESVYAKRL